MTFIKISEGQDARGKLLKRSKTNQLSNSKLENIQSNSRKCTSEHLKRKPK